MNAIEKEIYDLLCRFPKSYLSATEVSRSVGNRKWFNADRNWAKPILRRLELDGWLESNAFGEYRIKRLMESTTSFRQALHMTGVSLADTNIICLDDLPSDTAVGQDASRVQRVADGGEAGLWAA
jgi:hypothetical protein